MPRWPPSSTLAGRTAGLVAPSAQVVDQDTEGAPGTQEPNDAFGSSVAVGDVNGDGKGDLAAGSGGENGSEGSLHMLNGTASGVTVDGVRAFSSGTLGVSGLVARIGDVVLS